MGTWIQFYGYSRRSTIWPMSVYASACLSPPTRPLHLQVALFFMHRHDGVLWANFELERQSAKCELRRSVGTWAAHSRHQLMMAGYEQVGGLMYAAHEILERLISIVSVVPFENRWACKGHSITYVVSGPSTLGYTSATWGGAGSASATPRSFRCEM